MKNKRIIDSWNKIEPDSAADERILSAIIARNHAGQSERGTVNPMNKTRYWKRLAPIAACFVAVIALVAVVGGNSGWFGSKTLVADIDGGTLAFYKGSTGEGSYAWDADWGDHIDRSLTADESRTLFGELSVTGNATFRSTDTALMHFEGKAGDATIILAANGHATTDEIIKSNEENPETNDIPVRINGIPVTAGYFVTDANSKGIKNIIYFATFDVDGTTVYVELGGVESGSDALRTEIGAIIDHLTKNPPDSAAVTAE
jgi:hypothetical protein